MVLSKVSASDSVSVKMKRAVGSIEYVHALDDFSRLSNGKDRRRESVATDHCFTSAERGRNMILLRGGSAYEREDENCGGNCQTLSGCKHNSLSLLCLKTQWVSSGKP